MTHLSGSSWALWSALLAALFACSGGSLGPERIRQMHQEGLYAETLQPLSDLLDETPDDPELNHLYGVALLATQNSGMAVWPLRKAANHPGRSVEDGLLLARALLTSPSPEDAIRALNRVIEAEPNHIEALLLRVGGHLDLRKHEEVITDTERVLEIDPQNTRALLWRIKALAELKRLDDAEDALAQAQEYLPNSPGWESLEPRLCGTAAELALARGDSDEAEQIWHECIDQFPGAPALVDEALRFFNQRGDRELSELVLRGAVEARPGEVSIRNELADLLVKQGRIEDAEQVLRQSTQDLGESPGTWLALAEFYRQRNDSSAAARAMQQALRTTTRVSQLMLAQYADDLVEAGEFTEAEVVIADLSDPRLVNLLEGRMLLRQGDPAAALTRLEEGLLLWPGNATARWLAGRAAVQLGDFDRAIAEFRNSLRASAEKTDAALRLAEIHEAEGDYSAALVALGHRIRDSPKDAEAYRMMIRIARKAGRPTSVADGIDALSKIPGQAAGAITEGARSVALRSNPAAAAAFIANSGLDLDKPVHSEALEAWLEYLSADGRSSEAIPRLEGLRTERADIATFHELHARALEASGRPVAEVRHALDQSLELEPQRATAHLALARLTAREGQIDEALTLFDAAAAEDEESPEAALAALQLIDESPDHAASEKRLQSFLEIHPLEPEAATRLALYLLEENNDLERAAGMAARAIRFRGGAMALQAQSRIALARGNTAAAVRGLRRAVALSPGSLTTRYYLALALARHEKREEAIGLLNEILTGKDFPEADAAREALSRLQQRTPNG